MNNKKLLKNYFYNRKNELLGDALTADDRLGLSVFIDNIITDLSHSEAFILSLASANKDALKYASSQIKDGNSAYAEYQQGKTKRAKLN